ncbi:hypothetical protein J7355_13330 [Endozoicomonas sp. G2_2]|uniref:hypothetical protein n=1 Tax=Endozoicomonas sp. G2_2 TaxID=2821092 RepID=UPI001ADA3A1E|nr:hypothetical protein [Endozoicomonas sp. G2_2]MBO9471077.1 hypothetical protein [Endozoicomonas sp. G2_2]
MYRSNWISHGAGALMIVVVAVTAHAQPQWRDHRLPDGLANVSLEQRVGYLRRHLIEPANASASAQLASAAHERPTSEQLGAVARKAPSPIARDRLVIETFITPAMTDQVVGALCALKGIGDKVQVTVEHRNYVVLEPESVQPSVSVSTDCLDDWHATTDYGGEITRGRGVPQLPYFAAHYGGKTVQGDLASYRHKIEQLAMQYGL